MKPFQAYLDIRKAILTEGGSNDNADDVMDAFVFLTMGVAHLTDEDLQRLLINYREFETANPEYVQRGDALIA